MNTSKTSTDSSNSHDVDDAPPHNPGQLLGDPPVGGGASGSGGVDGSDDGSSGKAKGVPASPTSPDNADNLPSHTEGPSQDAKVPTTEADPEASGTGVDLSTTDDPVATAAAFASVGRPSESFRKPRRSTSSKVS
ncbi:hypothetical protein PF005_g28658 [Phytophthora fragariae]|uniref:Uncharacterized protein n=1 Tax=Phytophthora fragariae TaxID=53985 RepID=A0A6A3VHY9_9STRA|nr:hypothetical protein PF009_g27698 [Phytophthora fragariae]KAE9063298.1 hypothetical protein PF010_g29053 [Phytophthora fragariae]KAE9067599.1 hypothetical protein PF007_g28011 [Phytophthora fragariae]KAE9075639.1 hypothetical protein PF006_g28297 [Phytophthora fragariae]KAE9159056.1 hypothetical protein PF004_g31674 [Phytophthora fragariae]